MIQFLHVSKTYAPGRQALWDISLEIAEGDFVFLAGASGAGKSTLLKLLFREEDPSEGKVIVGAQDLARLNRRGVARLRRTIGLVFQECKLLGRLSAIQNVALAAEVIGSPMKASRIKAYQLLRELGLRERHDSPAFSLSAGEQQRVAIARALINEPRLVLADEPTGNLDAETADEIMRLLLRMRERGSTVIVATHDLGIIERYGSRVLYLQRGRLSVDRDWTTAGRTAR